MDAVHSGRFVGEPDPVRVRERWPVFGPAAVAAEIQETFSFPVTVDKITSAHSTGPAASPPLDSA